MRTLTRRIRPTLVALVALTCLCACDEGNEPGVGAPLVQLDAAGFTTCGVSEADLLYCWGGNDANVAGRSDPSDRAGPSRSYFGRIPVTRVTVGRGIACALDRAGAASCWGGDEWVPRRTAGDRSFVQLVADRLACGLAVTGAVTCWTAAGDAGRDIAVTATTVSVGGSTACALDGAGAASCWTGSSPSPVPVPGGLAFTDIAVGDGHACGLEASGAAWCWGSNQWGQLGDNTRTDRAAPVLVSDGGRPEAREFREIAAGDDFTCAVATSGNTFCWGNAEEGQLGYGGPDPSVGSFFPFPALATPPEPLSNLVAGGRHVCATGASGRFLCWGSNGRGQTGVPSAGAVVTAPTVISAEVSE